MRRVLKTIVQVLSLFISFPSAALCGFGRFGSLFQGFAQLFALFPGLVGDHLRVAFYVWTLRECSLNTRISFGTFFARSSVIVRKGVYIGPYCILGNCEIGQRTQIASHVQILSGRHQHERESDGRIVGANDKEFGRVIIGEDCWIGAAAIVMADIGIGSTIGAGSVVTRVVSNNIVMAGNPARPL
jgi:virginiamycin A acetyltransferase